MGCLLEGVHQQAAAVHPGEMGGGAAHHLGHLRGTLGGAVVSVLLMSLVHTMPVMTCFIYCAPVTS